MVKQSLILGLCLHACICFGQYDFEPVFRNLEGEELKSAVKNSYTPQSVLTLTQARDTLYRRVYYHKDSVRCIYTGRAKFLDINEDPSQYLFESGGNLDLNLEHSYPRSKGAEFGNASSVYACIVSQQGRCEMQQEPATLMQKFLMPIH